MELNLLCLYKVVVDNSGLIYKFNTKNDILYKITFSDASSYFSDSPYVNQLGEIFSLSIEEISIEREPFDAEVRKTIDSILQLFFLDTQKSLLYVCDTSDKKEYKRLMKFNKWYFDSRYKDNVAKMDESVTDQDGITYFSTLLFHNQNSFRLQLFQAHLEFMDSLRDK